MKTPVLSPSLRRAAAKLPASERALLRMSTRQVEDAQPFNWTKFLNRKRYTWDQLDYAVALAGDWVTCACGNQCAIIPRSDANWGEPRDDILRNLGIEFYNLIEHMAANAEYKKDVNAPRKKALRVLARIEARSAILIAREIKLRAAAAASR